MTSMDVLVVLVVDMSVLMFRRFVGMFVLVVLGKVQPDACGHECCRDDKANRQRVTQKH